MIKWKTRNADFNYRFYISKNRNTDFRHGLKIRIWNYVSLTAPIHLFTRYQLCFPFSCLAACYFFRLLFFPLFTLFFHYLLFLNLPLLFLFFSFKCFWYLNSIFPFLFNLSFFIFCFLLFLLSSFFVLSP